MLKALLIGYGYGGRLIHAPLIAACPGLELAGIVSSRTTEIAAAWPDVPAFPDLATALNHAACELVVVATPNPTHAAMAHMALDAGKHIVVDKPFAIDLPEARAIADHARDAGLIATAFQNRRWDGHILTAKALLASGTLGTISDVRLHYDRLRHVNLTRPGDQATRGGGVRLNLGSHLMDQAIHLFGRPDTLMADIFTQRPDAVTNDYMHVVLGYAGFRVVLHAGTIVPSPGPVIVIQGSAGAFIKYGEDAQEAQLRDGCAPGDDGWGVNPPATLVRADGETAHPPEDLPCMAGNYSAFYDSMVAAIRDGAPPPVAINDTLLVTHLLDLARRSADEGRRLDIQWPQ